MIWTKFAVAAVVAALISLARFAGPVWAASIDPLVKGNSAFALELYTRLAKGEKGNFFFSPASIHTALAMAYAGARGATADEMSRVLHFGLDQKDLHPTFASLINTLNSPPLGFDQKPVYQLCVANALWGQKGFPFEAAFVDLVKKSYGAGLHDTDFVKPEEARKTINDWVAEQTRDKIQDLIPAGLLQASMRLVLTNAVYFKAAWAETFDKSATQDRPFTTGAGQKVQIPMMRQERHFNYSETDDVQILELPYIRNALAMSIFLPKTKDGLGQFEAKLASQPLSDWLGKLGNVKVDVSLPRFKFTSSFGLGDTLQAMGIKAAFSSDLADFSGMTTAEKLFIAAVVHKAFVAVDEEGTEAAAATAVAMDGGAMPRPEEPKVFLADHPFIFLIRHLETGEVLFVGRVVNPKAE
ncbi:MAG: serpin family protein [Candidatus Riflebacteria bacterium]|nr:serpin family protein [Candidatus Riflebacteria bacterium]